MNKRTIQLIKIIYHSPGNDVQYYANKLNVSTRSIYNELQLVESSIKQYGGDLIRQSGLISLHIYDTKVFLEKFNDNDDYWADIYDTSEKRILYIILTLLLDGGEIDLFELGDVMEVSIATIKKDITSIRKEIIKLDLTISISDYTIKFDGSFNDLLHYFITHINNSLLLTQLLNYLNYDYISLKKDLIHILQANDVHIFDKGITQFITAVSIILNSNYKWNDNELKDLDKLQIDILNLFNIDQKSNKAQIIIQQLREFSIYLDETATIDIKAKLFHQAIIKYIAENYISDISLDQKFINGTYKHILYMVTRYNKGTMVNDGVSKEIKIYFAFCYEVALETIKSCQSEFDLAFIDDEIAYFAIHIATHYETIKKDKEHSNLNICLVMDVSYHYLLLLKRRLNSLLENHNIEINNECLYINFNDEVASQYDVIISDIMFEGYYDKFIFNNLQCTNDNANIIYKDIINLKNNRFNEIISYFSEDLFSNDNIDNKTDIITNMCNSLFDLNIVNDDFLNSVLKREGLGDTNINENVAIPHPIGLIANKSKVVVKILEKPVEWTDNVEVEIIILLAFSKDDIHKMKIIYDVLVEMIKSTNIKKFRECKKFSQFKEFIKYVL